MSTMVRRAFVNRWAIAGALILVALLPRLPDLGAFAGADEPFWVEQSISFVNALLRGDWAGLFQSPHPGIPPMAGYGLTMRLLVGELDRFHLNYQADMLRLLTTAAMFDVLVAALAVVGVYALACQVFDHETAALAGLVVALDPYFVGLSRTVGIDALLASFMTLAVLSLAAYLTPTRRQWPYLALAVLCGVLAFLTKLPALVLVPYGLVSLGLAAIGRPRPARRDVVRWGVFMLIAALLGGLALAATWGLMGARLGYIVRAISDTIVAGLDVPHEGGSYFLGEPDRPLDGTFYVWLLLLKTTPFSLVGAGLSLIVGLLSWRRWREPGHRAWLLLSLFVVTYAATMTLGAKKQDRYILPALLVLDLVAAWGWWVVLRWAAGRLPRRRDHADQWALVIGGTLLLLVTPFWLRLHPYYLAAYNPLLGGAKTAAWVYAVGWGEGLDQAAAYLNRQPEAADLLIASHNAWVLGIYARGQVVQLTAQNHYVADYIVFYYADALRNVPEPWVIERFRSQTPAFIAWIDGVPYAGVYRNPDLPRKLVSRHRPAVEHPLDVLLDRRVRGLGYDLPETAPAGATLPVTLYWECLEPMSVDYQVMVHLVDEAGRVWAQADHGPLGGHFATSFWQPGLFLRDEFELRIPADAPAGTYRLRVGLYHPVTNQRLRTPTGVDHFIVGPFTVR